MNETIKKAIDSLAEAIENSEELREYNTAKTEYEADAKLAALISEYNAQATLLEQEGKKSETERDNDAVSGISARLREVYDEISENPLLAKMRSAEEALSEVISEINTRVQHAIDPDAGSCTHDCGSCGGCH